MASCLIVHIFLYAPARVSHFSPASHTINPLSLIIHEYNFLSSLSYFLLFTFLCFLTSLGAYIWFVYCHYITVYIANIRLVSVYICTYSKLKVFVYVVYLTSKKKMKYIDFIMSDVCMRSRWLWMIECRNGLGTGLGKCKILYWGNFFDCVLNFLPYRSVCLAKYPGYSKSKDAMLPRIYKFVERRSFFFFKPVS